MHSVRVAVALLVLHSTPAVYAQEHRAAIERRNAERQAKGKTPSLPLPLPPTAAGSDAARGR